MPIKLNSLCRNAATGFTGIAEARLETVHGPAFTKILVRSLSEAGKPTVKRWQFEQHLTVIPTEQRKAAQ